MMLSLIIMFIIITSKTINEFKLPLGVFEWGNQEVFTWNIKVEFDNTMLRLLIRSMKHSVRLK